MSASVSPAGSGGNESKGFGPLVVRAARAEDHDQWRVLFHGQADFCRTTLGPEQTDRVWSWINDPTHEVSALVVEEPEGRLVGLAHYRPFARPLSATMGGYLDDLFVAADARGNGVAALLLAGLAEIARERGWSVVRWAAADDNYRARSVYDKLAYRTILVTYDMPPAD